MKAIYKKSGCLTHYYKVLLVDDEAEIREGMAQWIPWETLGFKIIEFAGEKTHYFNGGMIARRHTVRM